MSWLKDLLGKEIRTLIDGVESILPMRKTLRIIGSSAISAEDNPTAGTTDLYIAPSGSLSDVLSEGNDAGGKTIENLDEPLNDTDAATKGYVDNAVAVHDLSAVLEAGNDAGGNRIVNLPAPVSASEPQRAGDHVSHINIRAGGDGPTEVVINEELITQHGYNPEHTHVTVRFTQGGEKRVVLDTGAVGLLVTVYKSVAASSIVIEPGDGQAFRGSSAPVEVQPAVAAKRSFTIASIGNDWDFVGVPNIDGGVEGHMLASGIPGSKLADGSVTGGKIASGTVRNLHIATDADIDGSKLADGSVTGGKLRDESIKSA